MEALISLAIKALCIFKQYSYWLLLSAAFGISWTLHFSSASNYLHHDVRNGLELFEVPIWIFVALLGCVHVFTWRQTIKAARVAGRTMGVTFPLPHTHIWHEAKQQDGSVYTQVICTVLVKNLTQHALGLSTARLVKPKTKGRLLHSIVLIKDKRSPYSGTTVVSGYKIAPGDSDQVNIHLLIDTVVLKKPCNQVNAIVAISDDGGNEVTFSTVFNVQ